MPTLQPSTSVCHKLKLPELPIELRNKDIDETVKRRYSLDNRTGAATEICRSSILVHGGLTIPLNISHITTTEIQNELILYFAKRKQTGANFKNLQEWISNEIFSLDLITREWHRIPTTNKNKNETTQERLLHSMCYYNDNLYMFGGLIVSPQSDYELIATNELWKLDLQTMEWSLIGKDPQITRRFNHSMLIQNSKDETKDTKLVIVGGLNNMDQSIPYIDVFNITTNAWESVKSSNRIITNIEGKMVSLIQNKNCPVLLQDNEAEIPTLAYYMPLSQQKRQLNPHSEETSSEESSTDSDPENLTDGDLNKSDSKNTGSPIIALPLLSKAQGAPLISNQDEIFEDVQNSLQYESASYFNDNFILIGTTTNRPQAKLYCFFYNLHFSKWTMINIDCQDCDLNNHRFWKVFTWESHYQALLLGTQHDDFHSSSVQKFDHLLVFGLSMTNVLNRAAILPDFNARRNHSLSMPPTTPSHLENDPFKKHKKSTTSTSQFESYIKYITTPLDIEATTSIFPPYAMVLGKDGFDIYGESIADFDFISNEGDTVGVPSYLLRKRWGRYFDRLLSRGYNNSYAVYENANAHSSLVKQIPETISDIPETSVLNLQPTNNLVSQTSLESYFKDKENVMDPKTPNAQNSIPIPTKSYLNHKLSPTSSLYNLNVAERPDDVVNVIPTHTSNNRYEEFKNSNMPAPTMSSTNGMVFRVPFHDRKLQATGESQDPRLTHAQNSSNNRRRSSLAVQKIEGDSELNGSHSPGQYPRRASHPTQWNPSFLESSNASPKPSGLSVSFNPSSITNSATTSHRRPSWRMMSSSHNSRKASITSQSSVMSFVSSTSDRMGNPVNARRSTSASSSNRSSRSASPNPMLLNVPLPPLSNMPDDPIPHIPGTPSSILMPQASHRRASTTSRTGSLAEVFGSNRGSPFSSRRSSRVRRGSSIAGSISSIHSPKYSIDDAKYFISPTRTRRMSSCTSNDDSLESLGDHEDGHELEPLLTPRALYLPWSTATVQAFVEFFYTGQINKKWLLVPVVMDLLIMAKIYEIPLLHEMICEVIYAIIGKKEENLHYTCNSIDRGFNQLVTNYFQDDQAKVDKFLETNDAYRQLLNLKKSLNDIDDGFLVMKLLSDLSRNLSTSTNEDSENNDTMLSQDDLKSMRRSLSNLSISKDMTENGPTTKPSQHTGNPTGLSSLMNSDNNGDMSAALIKELLNQNDNTLTSETIRRNMEQATKERRHSSNTSIHKRVNEEELEQYRLQGLSGVDYDYNKDEHEHIDPKDLKKLYTLYDNDNASDTKVIMETGRIKHDPLGSHEEIEKNSSQSDSDEIDSQFDGLSKIKMKRQLIEDFELDESIDPLYRFSESEPDAFGVCSPIGSDSVRVSAYGNATRGSKTSKSTLYKGSFLKNNSLRSTATSNLHNTLGTDEGSILRNKKASDAESGSNIFSVYNGSYSRDQNVNFTDPTLENIISADALPPVDYIMKSIYRTTVLVNDPRIMIRCMECIELSKMLRLVKKKMSHAVQLLEEKTKKNERLKMASMASLNATNGHRSSVNAVPHRKDGSIATQTLPKVRTMSSIPNFKLKQISDNTTPLIDPLRRKSSKFNSISPRTSLSVVTNSNSNSSSSGNNMTNSMNTSTQDFITNNSSNSSSMTKLSMYPPFISSTISNAASPKTKKDSKNSLSNLNHGHNNNSSSGTSGFSFFGKKK